LVLTRLIRLIAILYGIVLTVLLLVPDPAALLGLKRFPEPPGERFAHFAFFAVLGLLACISRWPVRGWMLLAILAAYAVATELLQGLVPHRTPELIDLVEDFFGLGLGAYLGWIIQRRLEPGRSG
jgi:VanZ family protein